MYRGICHAEFTSTGPHHTPSMSRSPQPAPPWLAQYGPHGPHKEALSVHSWHSLGRLGVREWATQVWAAGTREHAYKAETAGVKK